MAGRQQTVRFFRLMHQIGGQSETPAQPDWRAVLDEWSRDGMEKEWIDGTLFHPGEQGLGLPVLGIHKPTSDAFRSAIDMKEAKVDDLVLNDNDSKRLADSTAVAFLPFANVIAVARGTGTSPKHGILSEWLNHCVPAANGRQWTMPSLKDPAKLEQLLASGGQAKKLEIDYVTGPDLFTANLDATPGRLHQQIETLGDLLGAPVHIKLELSIANNGIPPAMKSAAQKRMWDAAAASAHGIEAHSTKAALTVLDEEGRTSILNLVEQDYVITNTLTYEEEDGYTFSSLQRRLVDVALQASDTLTQLL